MLSLAIQLYTMPIQLYHYFTFPMLGNFSEPDRDSASHVCSRKRSAGAWNLQYSVCGRKNGGNGRMQQHCGSAFGFWRCGIGNIRKYQKIFRIAASACTGPGHYIFQLYEWLCIQVERVPFHSIVAGRPEMWKIGMFYVALGIRYVWSVGEARDNLERKGIFLFPKEWNAPEKNSVFIAVAVVFLVVQPVHGFQIWFLDVGQSDGVFLRTQDEAILSDCGSSQDKKIGKMCWDHF